MEKSVADPFLKKSKLRICLDQQSEFSYSLILLNVQVEDYEYICWNRRVEHLLLLRKKLFDKTEKGLELFALPLFLHYFWRKILLTLCSIDWPNFTVWLPLLLEISGNMFIVIVCYPICKIINFEIYLSFLIKQFFCMIKTKTFNEKSF